MQSNKEDFYKNATRKLLKTLDDIKISDAERHQAKKLTMLLRNAFKVPAIKDAVFSDDLGDDWRVFTYDSDGFCLTSSFIFADIMNRQSGRNDWQLMYIDELWTYGPHHYLKHIPSGTVFDLTYDQYTHYGLTVPYDIGGAIKGTKYHQDKAAQLITAINKHLTQKE